MKKINFFLLAGIFALAVVILIPSCNKEIYTDEDALAAMKEGLKYKNDLQKELAALNLTNELQILNLQSQLSIKEMKVSDSLARVGSKTFLSVAVKDVTGSTADLSGFSVSINQAGVMKTLTTDANGLVVFPDCVTGYASFVVTKTGFVRATGLLNIWGADYYKETTQQAIFVPVFPTDGAVAKVSGTLTAQLDLLTEAKELFVGGVVSLNFDDINDILDFPDSDLDPEFGIMGIVYDGGFMQSVKTGADGMYEFKVPKTKNQITYRMRVSTIQKKQKLLFGGSQYIYNSKMLDTLRVDSLATFFGYYPWEYEPVHDNVGYLYNYTNNLGIFPGVNLTIDAPAGPNTPTSAATINWAHMDSTLVTWNFTKFAFGNGSTEFTDITQTPVFKYSPTDPTKVLVETPAAAVINITNGKVISLNMTNGGVYKEYGRWFGTNGNVAPTQANGTSFKFLEQLSADDAVNWNTVGKDTTYQTAIAKATVILHAGKVKVAFKMLNDWTTDFTRRGKGYTAVPNVVFRLNTPNTADSVLTQANLKVNLLTNTGLSIDTLVLSKYTSTTGFSVNVQPVFSTFKENGNMWNATSAPYSVSADPTNTYKVDLLNGFKIADGGLGYKVAPKVRVQNWAIKQGTTGSWTLQTIAEAATTIDAEGRITAVAAPVMLDNFNIYAYYLGPGYYPQYNHTVSVPADVTGQVQAYARAVVDLNGTITDVLLYNEDYINAQYGYGWFAKSYGNYSSGKGYLTTPKIKVTPVGLTSVTKPAVLQAVVNSSGRISNIIIVDGGKGYIVRNDPEAVKSPDYLLNYIYTNGSSDFVYNIDLGSGWHGDPIDIFGNY